MIFQLTLVRCDTSMTSNITLWRFFLFFPVPMQQNKIIIIIKNPCITLNATAAFKVLPACLVKVNHATVSRRFLLSFFSPYLHYRQHISDFFSIIQKMATQESSVNLYPAVMPPVGGIRAVRAESNEPEFVSWGSPLGFSWRESLGCKCECDLHIYAVIAECLHC